MLPVSEAWRAGHLLSSAKLSDCVLTTQSRGPPHEHCIQIFIWRVGPLFWLLGLMTKNHPDDLDIEPGQIYEDCAYHPCLCLGTVDGSVWGISLIDGTQPRSCDLRMCGVRILTPVEAWEIKLNGPSDLEAKSSYPVERRWWR
jgi:hypothetical protein